MNKFLLLETVLPRTTFKDDDVERVDVQGLKEEAKRDERATTERLIFSKEKHPNNKIQSKFEQIIFSSGLMGMIQFNNIHLIVLNEFYSLLFCKFLFE